MTSRVLGLLLSSIFINVRALLTRVVAEQHTIKATSAGTLGEPLIFAVAFSFRDSISRRATARSSWKLAGYDMVQGPFVVKFGICTDGLHETALEALQEEHNANGDLLLLHCPESAERYPPPATEMSQKLVAAMESFRVSSRQSTMFMKLEDDTYVPWNRLVDFLAGHQPHVDLKGSFIGVPVQGKYVNRAEDSPWYQPQDTYSSEVWPTYMDRMGYLIGTDVVKNIVDTGIARQNLVTCEDQAAGVWVDKVRAAGADISYIALPAAKSFAFGDPVTQGTWGNYTYLLHHGIKRDYYSCLADLDGLRESSATVNHCFADSMFVAVFTARANLERRQALRDLYRGLEAFRITARFALCSRATDGMEEQLQQESSMYGDMLLLDCDEGYSRPLLTKKVVASMQAYSTQFANKSLFMKVDDDTFVSFSRLRKMLSETPSTEFTYIGTQAPQNSPVNRNPESDWYQPVEDYPNETYPTYMEGGPGYILGKELVQKMLDTGVAEGNLLSNEDQATGVWVDMLRLQGSPVEFVNAAGTDGYRPENDQCMGPWKDYPFVMHHKLDAKVIACLARLEQAQDGDALVETCFPNCRQLVSQFLSERLDQVQSEVAEVVGHVSQYAEATRLMNKRMEWLNAHGSSSIGSNLAEKMMRFALGQVSDTSFSQASNSVLQKMNTLTAVAEESERKLREATDELVTTYRAELDKRTVDDTSQASLILLSEAEIDNDAGAAASATTSGKATTFSVGDATSAGSQSHTANANARMNASLHFVRIPHNSGSAIEEAVTTMGFAMPRHHGHGSTMRDGSTCERYHAPPQYAKVWADVNTSHTFCVIRNPYDRVLSQFRHMVSAPNVKEFRRLYGETFNASCSETALNDFLQKSLQLVLSGERFVHDCNLLPQTDYIWGADGNTWCKNILRSETLPHAFNSLVEEYGFQVRLAKRQEASNKSLMACPNLSSRSFSQDTLGLLNKVYAEDFLRLNYTRTDFVSDLK